jgi:uncharacterized caspase-like protein
MSMAKGISLHIGIDKYNRSSYGSIGKNIRNLPNCVNDANAMIKVALQARFNAAILINENATAANLLQGISLAAQYLEYGDLFFLTFSGHGGLALDRNGDEDGNFDQTWCLHDKEVVDDELFEHWKLFRPGVRVVVIADSCHSGTCTKDYGKGVSDRPDLTYSNKEEVQASCLLMAACQDWQKAPAGNNISHSLYTYCLLKVMERPDRYDNYIDLNTQIQSHMPKASQPNLFKFGPNADKLARSRPFRI